MGNKIIKGYKYRIYPTEEQSKQIDQQFDLFRFVYNWGIAKEQEIYEQYKNGLSDKKFYTFIDLCNIYTIERKNNPKLKWLKKFGMGVPRNALKNVVFGYKLYFNKVNNIPHFKKKNKCKKSFSTRKDTFKIKDNCIKIEGVNTLIPLGFNSNFFINENYKSRSYAINPVITKDNLDNYYVSFSMEEEVVGLPLPKTEGIGIDLGVRRTFTLSNGEIYNQPKEKLDRLENKRRKQQRHVTRDINRRLEESYRTKTKYEDIPKSKRAIKREIKLNKIYRKIHNIKDTFYHTITKKIVDMKPEYVCMETFSVTGLCVDDKRMYKILDNVSFYDIIEKMKYKCEEKNIPFIQAPRSFASTKICNNCGHKKNMNGKHVYKCPVCGMIEDRDINAAINLKNYGYNYLITQ